MQIRVKGKRGRGRQRLFTETVEASIGGIVCISTEGHFFLLFFKAMKPVSSRVSSKCEMEEEKKRKMRGRAASNKL